MKRIITKLGMIVAMLLSFLPASAYDFEVDGIYYEVVSLPDLTCQVVKGNTEYSGDIVIPGKVTYNGRELTVVGVGKAFEDNSLILSLSIPDTVIEIERYAFYGCESLEYIEIPNSVTKIGECAFYKCSSLTSINIPNSVTEIGNEAFKKCKSLTDVVLSDSLTEIEHSMFEDCHALTAITIPDSVTKIGGSAFVSCRSLRSVNIPNHVTEIGGYAFAYCKTLEYVNLSNDLNSIEACTFIGCESLLTLTIPGSVEYIDILNIGGNFQEYLFSDCKSLTHVEIEYGKTPINFYTLEDSDTYYEKRTQNVWPFRNSYESFFIDREIGSEYILLDVKNYIIGEHIVSNKVQLNLSNNLETITCLAAEPPTLGELTNSQYIDVIVKVPQESLEAYQQAEGWKNFWNLQGFDPSGVDKIGTDPVEKTEIGRFNLNGQKVTDDYDGIVIVRYSDGSTRKMIQK